MNNKRTTLKARKFFITISDLNPEINSKKLVEERLLKEEEFLSHYLIAQQNHTKENSIHFHIYLKYSKTRDFSPKHYDYLALKHPNVQKVKSIPDTLTYCTKEDPEPLSNFNYIEAIFKTNYLKKVADLLDKGLTEEQIFNISTEQSLKHHTKVSSYLKKKLFLAYKQQLTSKKPLSIIPIPVNAKPQDIEILESLNQMIIHKGKRARKSFKSLYLYSKRGNTGKTLLLDLLKKIVPYYNFPRDHWFDGYLSGYYHLIAWNEATFIGYDMDYILQLLEGAEIDLQIKGSKAIKSDNPLIIMTSNFSLEELLKNKYSEKGNCNNCNNCSLEYRCSYPLTILTSKGRHYLPLLKLRIKEVQIPENYDLFPLIDYLIRTINPDPELLSQINQILEPIKEENRLVSSP